MGEETSRLPDPRNEREAIAAPDADGWKAEMDKQMEILKSHGVHKLVPRTPTIRTLRLSWACHRKLNIGNLR